MVRLIYAGMAELADALDLGSSGKPCRFDPCYPQNTSSDSLCKENLRKVEKTLKKVLTKGVRCGIIYESPRERLTREQKAREFKKTSKKLSKTS